ncbi:hypothetical protein M422DRAFT_241124 [Sphaerobolus stellatus SS14]|nr:hypothetical protein M422DRAFT_241124 [Sphaerobolus stellatus SS14]
MARIAQCPECTLVAEDLIRAGFFPVSPIQPTTAFSFDVLDSYVTCNPELTYAVAPFCRALVHDLQWHGYSFSSKEPFKNQLPEALIWYDALKLEAENQTQQLLRLGDSIAQGPSTASSESQPSSSMLAHWRLRHLCPACFGQSTWGGDAETNPDVQVAIDGNFMHCCYASVEADPQIFSTDYQGFWLTEEELNSAHDHVQKNSNNSCSSTRQASRLPGGSLD